MARITLDHVRHAYGTPRQESDYALKEVHAVWSDGGAYALLGPSGCGKTTLLNIISGLLRPSEGRILFDDQDMTDLPTGKRNIAQVFQFPVVYDGMTLRENIAFPLRNRGFPRAETEARVAEILRLIDLEGMADRRARGLTADQKQKISLGRGLARPDVNAILFDEPLTVIDPQMKWRLRAELKALHRRSGFTMVYVTHDQTEALTFADRVAVMHDGRIVQMGTPEELFLRPEHSFVGYFIGSPGMNLLPVRVEGGEAILGEARIPLGPHAEIPPGARTEIGLRPEMLRVGREGWPLVPLRLEDVGRRKILRAELYGHPLAVALGEDAEIPADPRLDFAPEALNLYAGGWRIGGGRIP
ncbi:ABC transporter ATP-binding protein [Neomegalonema sp.]|uniref:ABC transporter ATP-binding protein n=1 Tax=Neomegalonema sp. TaxID=2039713 RepID=UPI002628E6CA|nr:ABC transporter ATP-binding protein [Neomegalonema sp.]MDD2868018.1 ABC transporter ATP-binding protein [Neomegalonema sp.]